MGSTNENAEIDIHIDEEDGEISTGDEIETEPVADVAENSYAAEEVIQIKIDDQTTSATANATGAATFSTPSLEGEKTLTTSIHPSLTEFSGGTPEGEALQNMIQAYYWAGYYKGLYEGLQQAKNSNER